MKIAIIPFSEVAKTPYLNLTAEYHLLTEEEMRATLLARVQERMKPLLAEEANVQQADLPELRRRYGIRFWKR